MDNPYDALVVLVLVVFALSIAGCGSGTKDTGNASVGVNDSNADSSDLSSGSVGDAGSTAIQGEYVEVKPMEENKTIVKTSEDINDMLSTIKAAQDSGKNVRVSVN